MRNFLTKLLIVSALFCAAGLSSCTTDPSNRKPSMEVSMTTASWNTIDATITTTNISKYAYVILRNDEVAPTAVQVFMSGEIHIPMPGTQKVQFQIGDLERNVDYTIYVAGQYVKDGAEYFYDRVFSHSFFTEEYEEDICVIRRGYDGAYIRFTFPKDVAERKNKVKWGIQNIALYNYHKVPSYRDYYTDAFMVYGQNDNVFKHFIINRDTLITVEDSRIMGDNDGPYSSEYWDVIVPGEPLVFLASEVTYFNDDYAGWGPGWYSTPFDEQGFDDALYAVTGGGNLGGGVGGGVGGGATAVTRNDYGLPNEEDYWPEDTFHTKIKLRALEPDPFAGKVKIEIKDMDTDEAQIVFTPDKDVFQFAFSVLDDATYQQILKSYLDGDESYMQWFITSYFSMMSGFSHMPYAEGQTAINLSDYLLEVIAGTTYHVFVTAAPSKEYASGVDVDLSRQSFQKTSFTLPEYTLPISKVVATPVETTDPYNVYFNIRCTNYDVAPVGKAKYLCNYSAAWVDMLTKYSYSEMVDMYGVALSADDIEQINSDEGLTIFIPSRDDATSRIAVKVWNEEGRVGTSLIGTTPTGVADSKSGRVPDAERVESPYFESLNGDWTATATVRYTLVDNETKEETTSVVEHKTKVTIGNPTYPETLTEDVYNLFAEYGVSREKTDKYFAEFKELNAYNEQKTRGQNRILCNGLDFNASGSNTFHLEYMSPFDLFTSPYYNSTTEGAFYDFGPKWYIQVAADGSLFVPVNVQRVNPLATWSGTTYHLTNYCEYQTTDGKIQGMSIYQPLNNADMDNIEKWGNLPVEVSEDGNTITIKPYIYRSGNYEFKCYPNIMQETVGKDGYSIAYTTIGNVITSEIVLTRGWVEPEAPETPETPEATKAHIKASNGQLQPGAKIIGTGTKGATVKFHTSFAGIEPKAKSTLLEYKAVTFEQGRENLRKAMEARNAARSNK